MALQTVRTVSRSGILISDLAVAADVAGDTWANSGAEMVYIKNGDASSHTVTLVYNAAAVFDGATVSNKTVTVAAGKEAIIGPFPQAYYNNSSGIAQITYDAVTSVTVCVFKNGT